jgi:hypothetical protein
MTTPQEALNIIWPYATGPDARKARNISGIVAYRAADGRPCFIGMLIPDDLYDPALEGYGIGDEDDDATLNAAGIAREDVDFFVQMQRIHDNRAVHKWPRELRDLAGRFGLTIPENAT